MRTIVTRAVGVRPAVDLDESPVDVLPGDVFLLCTDGLTRMLHDRLIADSIQRHGIHDLDATAQALVAQANAAGGKDNITVLLVRVDESANPSIRDKPAGWRSWCAPLLRRIPWIGRKLHHPTGPALG